MFMEINDNSRVVWLLDLRLVIEIQTSMRPEASPLNNSLFTSYTLIYFVF